MLSSKEQFYEAFVDIYRFPSGVFIEELKKEAETSSSIKTAFKEIFEEWANKMAKDDLEEAIAGIALGILGGIVLTEILNRLIEMPKFSKK